MSLEEFCETKLTHVGHEYGSSEYGRYQTATSSIYLSTGYQIKLPDLYARNCSEEVPAGQRYVLRRHFSILGESTHKSYSQISMAAVACPSYESANELLKHFNDSQCSSRVRNLTNEIGRFCYGKEADLVVDVGKNLKGKKVVISIDGGRCRTRENSEKRNAAGNRQFDTDWREPKLFVIQVLDGDENLEKDSKPIYGIRFDEIEFWELLKLVLKRLGVEDVKSIQIIADGAQWIWDEIEVFMMQLGVSLKG